MNAAGNADSDARVLSDDVRTQLFLTLTAWLALSCVLLSTRALSFFEAPSGRELYDATALSSLVVFLATLVTVSVFRVSARPSLLVSSILLTTTYYARLLHILLSAGGSAIPLPLVTILQFGRTGSSVVSLDLGQLGLYTLSYILVSSLRARRPSSAARSRRSSSDTASSSGGSGDSS